MAEDVTEAMIFGKSKFGCNVISRPIDDDVVTPYVKLTFVDADNNYITVGNKSSSAPNHTAIIKSFKYAGSDGLGCSVEIYDEEGGDFKYFVNRIVKSPETIKPLYKAVVQWGWITTGCDGDQDSATTFGRQSRCHVCSIDSIDIKPTNHGITFDLEMIDDVSHTFEHRDKEIYEMKLKEAIKALFASVTPPITDIQFLRRVKGSTDMKEFKFLGDVETKVCKFNADNLSPLAAARKWISSYQTDRNKGIIVFYDNTIKNCSEAKTASPRLIFLEDPLPNCNDAVDSECSSNIGTYIVNGGKFSPVISFDPKIKFNFSFAAQAATAVSSDTAGAKEGAGLPCPPDKGGTKTKGTGTATSATTPEHTVRNFGKKDAAAKVLDGQKASEKANSTYELIEAELTIQGNPQLDNFFELIGKSVSVIYVNPHRLSQNGDGTVDWLVEAPINSILSHKKWMINGCGHEIKEGSYTTTLSLYLTSPGS
jgi:hypothetical protein